MGVGMSLASVAGLVAQAAPQTTHKSSPTAMLLVYGAIGLATGSVGYLRARRRRSVAGVAARNGLAYADSDPFGCARGPLAFLHQGDHREVGFVLWRTAPPDPRHTRVFDLRFLDDRNWATQGRAGQQVQKGRTATCATAIVNGAFPHLAVRPVGLTTEVRDLVLGDKIDLESEDFNRAFDVRCGDRRFAVAFLDARMQQLLLDHMLGLTLEVQGAWVLVHAADIPAKAVPGLFGLMDDLVAAIPPVVNSLYPAPLGPDPLTPMVDPYVGALSESVLHAAVAQATQEHGPATEYDLDGNALPRVDTERPEYDLDGHVVPPHQQDPWGKGRELP